MSKPIDTTIPPFTYEGVAYSVKLDGLVSAEANNHRSGRYGAVVSSLPEKWVVCEMYIIETLDGEVHYQHSFAKDAVPNGIIQILKEKIFKALNA